MNEQLFSAAEAALRKADLLRPSVTLLVALSGGADSVVLLRTLCGLDAQSVADRVQAVLEHRA